MKTQYANTVEWRGGETMGREGGWGRNERKMDKSSPDSVCHLAKEEDSVKWRSSIHTVDKPTWVLSPSGNKYEPPVSKHQERNQTLPSISRWRCFISAACFFFFLDCVVNLKAMKETSRCTLPTMQSDLQVWPKDFFSFFFKQNEPEGKWRKFYFIISLSKMKPGICTWYLLLIRISLFLFISVLGTNNAQQFRVLLFLHTGTHLHPNSCNETHLHTHTGGGSSEHTNHGACETIVFVYRYLMLLHPVLHYVFK